MPPKTKAVCKQYQQGRCSYGAKCKFAHTGKSSPAVSNNQAPQFIADLPRGTCRSFWESGRCNRGYECKYQHVSRAGQAAPIIPPASSPATTLDEEHVERYVDAFSDGFAPYTLNPSQVHAQIKPFIQPESRFSNNNEIHQFATILGSVGMYNSTWDIESGQDFFAMIADPNGEAIHRIQDILLHESVSSEASQYSDISFQRVYLPVLGYLSSRWVVRSTLRKNVNALYGLVDHSFEELDQVLENCIGACMARKSFNDSSMPVSGLQVFRVITKCLYEYATRFKNAVAQHPCFATLVTKLVEWSNSWASDVCASPPRFTDPISGWTTGGKAFAVERTKKAIDTLFEVVERAEGSTLRRPQPGPEVVTRDSGTQALLDGLQMTYDGPGVHHEGGVPRHDNDKEDVSQIEVVPTHAELTCPAGPYLPANLPDALHHLPASSMERLVDIQFRLLREELIAPIRSSLAHVLHDYEQPAKTKTQLDAILAKSGGLYKAAQAGWDSVMFSVYTGVNFKSITCDPRRGLAVDLTFDTPSGRAKDSSAAKRSAYWESVGKRRLMQGGLVGLLWVPPNSAVQGIRFYLGTVTSSLEDLRQSAKQSADRLAIKVSFFDAEVDIRILNALQQRRPKEEGMKLLLEAPIMFESIRPFLETLKSRPPASIPFSRYIAHQGGGNLSSVTIDPPAYVTPRFAFTLDSLFDSTPPINLSLQPHDEASVQQARDTLKAKSRLDPSQADALVNALTSEVSLIQGPPGTGKSFTGVELLRVLISNNIRPILLIAFTNHALDNIISHVLEKGLTNKIIRLGSRSNDETVAQYTLETVMRTRSTSQADRSAGRAYAKMKDVQEEMSKLMEKVVATKVEEKDFRTYLQQHYPLHEASTYRPPSWVQHLFNDSKDWHKASKRGNRPQTLGDFWRNAEDVAFLNPPPVTSSNSGRGKKGNWPAQGFKILQNQHVEDLSAEEDEEEEDAWLSHMTSFFAGLSINSIPHTPSGNRPIDQLLNDPNVWSMSAPERQRLHAFWTAQHRDNAKQEQKDEFSRLKARHAETRSSWSDILDQGKLEVLSKADLIGCTTNGAAKLTSLLQSVAPKVLLVEEAGQVLEAHILASLVPSIEHLILIGDPLQLRPTIENYQLSMDNPRTGKVFRFDQSLMERLSTMGLHMSQLDVQRRMRPQISNLVRQTLYPKLQDHEIVRSPPSIRGMARDVFFLDHRNAEESGGDDSASKTNTYEAKMIKDLVLYFLKQGKYTKTGDIVVLCAYLGQLAKVRKLLSTEVATVIDERDAVQLINHGDDDEAADILADSTEQVHVAKRVLLRTVDNFQGEEGTIVILSLVRNSGDTPTSGRKIGFLRSTNRANVALSRAREGLYILGNADDLLASKSQMWSGVIEQLRQTDQIGPAFPLACSRHPDTIIEVSKPGQIAIHAPDGGCLESCNSRLKCGHVCPLKCHPDDPQHKSVRCVGPCVKFCARSHPCSRPCSAPCGLCEHPTNYAFPCGHMGSVRCHQIDNPQNLRCSFLVPKPLPRCGHSAIIACSDDAKDVFCQMPCGAIMPCCGRPCQDLCGNCQALNAQGPVVKHTDHRCGKALYCGHSCSGVCTTNHDCADYPCQDRCRQRCGHHVCALPCTDPCAPCMQPCEWVCEHRGPCPVVCGAPCARLPCDLRCDFYLACGHRCPSVCGEPCEKQICPLCANETAQTQVVDVIMGKQLCEIDPHGEELDELTITLACGHVFTVETLDGICELEKYYTRDDDDAWTSIAPPPQGLQRPPTCPHCREPIKSLRYGRVYKRADLDMSEQNVATSCRRALRLIHEGVAAFNGAKISKDLEKALENLPPGERAVGGGEAEEELNFQEKKTIRPSEPLPLPSKRFDKKSSHLRPIPKTIKDAWVKATRRLLAFYEDASKVATTTSSHVRAYEAAVATLYRQYLNELGYSSLPGAVTPEDMALGLARKHCGLPAPPKADVRFRVEACWLTFNIRFHMVTLAQKVAEILVKAKAGEKVRMHWADMIEDIIYSVERDASMAIEVARKSQSNRQIVRTALFLMEAQYQAFSHRVDRYLNPGRLDNLKEEAREGCAKAKVAMEQYSRLFREAMDFRLSDQEWLKDNYGAPAEAIVAKWAALITRLNGGYTPVTEAEKREIVKALMGGFLGIKTRGHFYQCPNGHAYVITECGGAMEESRCPECNSVIGGTSHTLNSSNTRAMDLENIGQEEGMAASPFAWGQGA